MLRLIKELLLKIVSDIDSGNTNASPEELLEIAKILSEYNNKDIGFSKYSACKYLGISRATFDRYVKEGKIPKGKHVQGFKELRWYKSDLNKIKSGE